MTNKINSLKERFDDAFNGLLKAGDNLIKVRKELNYAERLILKNKRKQILLSEIIKVNQ